MRAEDATAQLQLSPSRIGELRRRHPIVGSLDFLGGIVVGTGAGVAAAFSASVRTNGFTALLALGGADIAVLGVSLIAVQLFVTLLDPEYELVLSHAGGVHAATKPYLANAAVAGMAAAVAITGAIAWSLAPAVAAGLVMGAATWLCIWAVFGTVQLVEISIFHVEQRSKLAVAKAKVQSKRPA